MASKDDLQWDLDVIEDGSERMERLDFLGRQWVAEYVASVDRIADELRRRLENEEEGNH